ncbi:MAG: GIY-YIG nuclease family protein [Candidatus Muiribacteriota bacterium]
MQNTFSNLYIIILFSEKKVTEKVGKLGVFTFEPGYYFYIGSAKNNIEKRVERHFRHDKKLHWHIDYITTVIKPVKAVIMKNVEFSECELSQAVHKEFNTEYPVRKFGSSDCKCHSHLHFKRGQVFDIRF